MNTFSDHEWGEGREPADDFNPKAFDARQWARVVKDSGMRGIIITAKHHDGFCLWPSATTEYSVKNSKWRDGKGDVLRELADACREYGLKFGIYISPWTGIIHCRTPIQSVYKQQWRELLTNYGDVLESWLDRWRQNDDSQFRSFFQTIRRQPGTIIFSDAGQISAGSKRARHRPVNKLVKSWREARSLRRRKSPEYRWRKRNHLAPGRVRCRSSRAGLPRQWPELKSVAVAIYYGSVGRNATCCSTSASTAWHRK